MKKLLAVLFFILLFVTQLFAQQIATGPKSISADKILAHVTYLSKDQMRGRNTPSPELDSSAAYIARQFHQYGLKPVGDNGTYLQHFNVLKSKLSKPNSLTIIAEAGETEFEIKQDFVPLYLTANKKITAAIVFAGYGITAPEYNYDDYKNIDVNGKIVLIFTHEPQENDPTSVFEGRKMTDHSKSVNKALNARDHGAIGMIIVTDPNHRFRRPPLNWPSLMRTKPKDATPLTVEEKMDNKLVVVRIGKNLADQLFEKTGKTMADLQSSIDTDLASQSYEVPGIKVRIETNLNSDPTPTQNVVGLLEGIDPVLKNEIIVISAHYDHLGALNDSTIFNGADDNASGTVGVMTLAEAFTTNNRLPKRSILFCAWAGEEKGLFGSRYYVDSAPLFPLETTTININLDMIGRYDSSSIDIVGISSSPDFFSLIEKENEKFKFEYSEKNEFINRSDHGSFYRKKIPVLGFSTGLHNDYHQTTDTVEKCFPEGIAQICKFVFNITWILAEKDQRWEFTEVN